MNQRLLIPVLVAALALLVACDKQGNPGEGYTHSLYDLVTLVSSDTTTGITQFELVKRDHSTQLLTARMTMTDSKPPQRLLLRYNYSDEAMGNIKVYGVARAITDSLRSTPASLDHYARHPVRMRSAWRTGDFINLHCLVEHTGKNRTLMMIIDPNTRDNDTVHCYLHHDLLGNTAYHWRECYASFNVGNVWKRTHCTTLRLHINEHLAGEKCYDFTR